MTDEELVETLNDWFSKNDINNKEVIKNSHVAQCIKKNLKLLDRWKNSPRKVQGIAANEFYEDAWQGMPEFIQENLMPFKSILVHFENQENVSKFAALVDQKITNQTKSLWYPKSELIKPSEYTYAE